MPATAEPPVATPAPAAPAPTPAPAPSTPKGSPMERAFSRMDEVAVPGEMGAKGELTAKPAPKPAPKAAAPEPPKPAATDAPPAPAGDELEGDEAPPAAPAPAKPGDEDLSDAELKAPKPPQQAGPWKLKKYWEKRAAAVEQELAEARKRVADADRNGEALKRAADIEKRNAELEEEIRYHNYAKSAEFADKHQKPWEESWARAIGDATQLNIQLEDGSVRKATQQDLLALYNMPLDQVDEVAEKLFGKSAHRVIRHVEKLKEMADAQVKALNDARKTATDRSERSSATQQAIAQEVTSLWASTNAELASKLDLLKPKEGDAEWNAKLTAATALADEAFSKNASDPSLTPEQRAALVKKHAAIRNRAVAYSTLKLENARLRAQLKERDDKLAAFDQSAPNGGNGGAGEHTQPKPAANPMDRAMQRLDKAAVPGGPRFY